MQDGGIVGEKNNKQQKSFNPNGFTKVTSSADFIVADAQVDNVVKIERKYNVLELNWSDPSPTTNISLISL